MNIDDDFEIFYTVKLAPVLKRLKDKSKQADTWVVIGLFSGMLAFLVLFSGSQLHALENYGAWFFILFSGVVFSVFKYVKKKDVYTGEYKTTVIREIIKHVSPRIEYKPGEMIDESEYARSSLFRRYYDNFYGDDYMEGLVNNIHFRCSEIQTNFETGGNHHQSIFKGLFFAIAINSRFTGGAYVWAKGNEQIPDSIYAGAYRMMPMPEISFLDFNDPGFGKYFSAYANHYSQAVEILSPKLRQQLISIRKQLDRDISISFVAGECFIAIPFGEDILEPPNWNQEFKKEILKDFQMIHLVVNTIKNVELSNLL